MLESIADMLELKNDNPYRILAYRKAAHTIHHLDEDLRVLYTRDAVGEIPGIGSTIRGQIEEMLETDSCYYCEELKQEVPGGLLDMLTIPGLGHKTIRSIHEKLGIDNLETLAAAAEAGIIRTLPGMGAKTEYNILKGIDLFQKSMEKITLGLAVPMAEEFSRHIMQGEGVIAACPVGSVRRGKPLVGDIDLLVAAKDFQRVKMQVRSYRNTREITGEQKDSIQGILNYNMKFEVIMTAPADYFHNMIWTTGSKEFRETIFRDLDRQSLRGLASEEEVFRRLNMQYIPPEMRENRGEIQKAREFNLPELVKLSDIKGELHVHTDWSDGAHSLPEMAAMAHKMGYSYLAVTDHSKSLHISGGLSEKRLMEQGQLIEALNHKMKGLFILKGSEVDILKDGTLDYSDDILQSLDLVIASIHSHFNLDSEQQTARIIKAIENPHVDIIGHLTGRLLNRRPPYELDVDRILAAAAEHQTALEINAHPDRLDVNEDIAAQASRMGIRIAINSDAHDKRDLNLVKYGVLCARRAWLTREDVINTWDIEKVIQYFGS
jgi:DNA polymerase (family 10)